MSGMALERCFDFFFRCQELNPHSVIAHKDVSPLTLAMAAGKRSRA
jgi:hypothetical protein